MNQYSEVITTVPSEEVGKGIAQKLLDDKLAACVQIGGPVTSCFRWQGKVETEREFRCTIKTTAAAFARVATVIRQLHPYELPEITKLMVDASPEFASWVAEQVDG